MFDAGSILAAKAKSDEHLREAKKEAKRVIHAFHKARDSKVSLEVSACRQSEDVSVFFKQYYHVNSRGLALQCSS